MRVAVKTGGIPFIFPTADIVTRAEFAALLQRVTALELLLAPKAHAMAPTLAIIAVATKGIPFAMDELWMHAELDADLATVTTKTTKQKLGMALSSVRGLRIGNVAVTRLDGDREGRRWKVENTDGSGTV